MFDIQIISFLLKLINRLLVELSKKDHNSQKAQQLR